MLGEMRVTVMSSGVGVLTSYKARDEENPPNSIMVKLAFLNPWTLKPHEKYIEARVAEVRESIVKSRCLVKPLIVDENTLTVIDGAHRLEVLKRLDVSKVPVLAVNYLEEDEIRVERWIRVYRGSSGALEELLKLLKSEIPGSVVRKSDTIVYRVHEVEDPASVYWLLGDTEGYLTEITLSFTNEKPRRPGRALVLIPPRLGKRDVVKAAVEGKLFPPKTTRHITVLKRIMLRTRLSDLF
jgi:hypothetical protein